MPSQILLAHLSDIHFRYQAGGDVWDLDADLRHELELDLQGVAAEVGPFRGLVVTGDVAFSGQTEEYDRAAEWLASLARIAGCRKNDVWMVPGNHDVTRQKVAESKTIQDFHTKLRQCDPTEIDRLMYEYLVSDPTGGDAHLAPLENYIAFATRYECAITAQRPFWDSQIDIGDSAYKLRIRGLTSPLISDEHDDPDGNRLVLGRVQGNVSREPGSILMTLSHHPPSWLRDGDVIEDLLSTRAHVQLWGHRHTQRAREMDGNLHLFAGAVHPQRGELDWEPRYNILRIEVDGPAAPASVSLDARVWRRQDRRFGPDFEADGERYRVFPVTVEPHIEPVHEDQERPSEPAEIAGPRRDARRALAFRFSSLPYQRRLSVARELELLDPESRDLKDQALFELVLSRAVRRDLLAELWSAVQRERPEPDDENPFAPVATDR